MFYCPYGYRNENSYREAPKNSYIRVFHASPNAPAVDVYANDTLIVENLAYKEFSEYIPVSPGSYNIKVYATGRKVKPVLETTLAIPENYIYTVAAIGLLPNISLYPIRQPNMPPMFGRPCMRFIHLSPDAPAVDVTLEDGTQIFKNVQYKDVTDYVCIPSGTYTLQIRSIDTGNVILTIPNVQLIGNNFYSIYAVGLVAGEPPLQTVTSLERIPTTPMMREPNGSAPTAPPPSFTPSKESTQLKSGPQMKAVDPGAIKPCVFRTVYIWPRRGHGFWAFLIYVGPRSASGYKWNGRRWVYFGMDLKDIDSFECY